MKKTILNILLEQRKGTSVTVQKILTEWGCIIKTRIGLHAGVLDDCTETGLIILELVGEKEKHEQLNMLLANLPGVKTELVVLEL